ncbi:thioredoxin-like domain-containing protein [Leadbetterella sp. DM7]|uniref:redoxin family protein n=1 Tax=Leadbetterella sp. DM7 TaxID=3235085 RepID=UPI00349EF381
MRILPGSLIILSILLLTKTVNAQESFATVSFEKHDTTGNDQLLYYIFNDLGKVKSGWIKGTIKIPVRKDQYDFCYISNTLAITGLLYLQHGDSVKLVQEPGGKLRYRGSHEAEFKLLEILSDKDIITFRATKDIPSVMSTKKAIPYTLSMIDAANHVIDSFTVANPLADKEILEMIRIDAKYKYLNGLFSQYAYSEYSDENYGLITPILERETRELENFRYSYNYGAGMSWFKMYMGLSMYLHETKKQVMHIGEKGYAQQMVSILEFYDTLPGSLREDIIFYTLNDFLQYKKLEGIDVSTFANHFYPVSTHTERLEKIKERENIIKAENNAKKQAELIIKEPELRATQLIKPDGSTITFGQLFDSLKGNGIYIDIWATWCAPCRMEMNKLDTEFFKNKNTKTVFLSLDEDEETWKNTVQKQYAFGGLAGHYRLKLNNITLQRLMHGFPTIPRYIYINQSQTEVHHNVLKPTLFNL